MKLGSQWERPQGTAEAPRQGQCLKLGDGETQNRLGRAERGYQMPKAKGLVPGVTGSHLAGWQSSLLLKVP